MIDQPRSESRSLRSLSSLNMSGPSLYELLDVSTQSTRLQIRESYIRLRSTYSSGSQALYSLVSDEEARQTLESIEEAYRILDDEHLRKEYDDLIGVVRESLRPHSFDTAHLNESVKSTRRSLQSDELSESKVFDGSSVRSSGVWDGEAPAQEARPHRPATPTTPASKIRKVADRILSAEQKAQEDAILGKPEGFDGVVLTRLRELYGVPQSEIQERTKIAIEYIKALENNDFHKLPSLVYVRGFLKIYLQYLGVQDAKALIDGYAEKFHNWAQKHRPHS